MIGFFAGAFAAWTITLIALVGLFGWNDGPSGHAQLLILAAILAAYFVGGALGAATEASIRFCGRNGG